MTACDSGFRFKLCMYWGSKWKTYFGLYYATTFETAHAALEQYSFPITKKRRAGWAIQNLVTDEVFFSLEEYQIKHGQRPEPVEDESLEDDVSELGVLLIEKSRLFRKIPSGKRRL